MAHTVTPFMTVYSVSGTTFVKLANPATLPGGANAYGCAFSPSGEFLSVTSDGTPFVQNYQLSAPSGSATTLTKLADPGTLPPAVSTRCTWLSLGGGSDLLVVPHNTSPWITIYQRVGTTFTKLADPASLPTGLGRSAAFSPDGSVLSIAHSVTPFMTVYDRNGLTFTKRADPATLPAGTLAVGNGFSPNQRFLAIGSDATPFIQIYESKL
jgi:hypothetical protein